MHRKVLIVESNPSLATLWSTYLGRHGFDAAVFIDNQTDANTLLAWGLPDVLIVGGEVGERPVSGEELCQQIYGHEQVESRMRPVIQVYGSYLDEARKKRFAGNAFLLLQKPVTPAVLLEAVRKAWFRALSAGLQHQAPAAMTAELAGQALVGILQFIADGKRTGYVLVEGPAGQAVLMVIDGVIVDARCGILNGAEAVYEILSWAAGQAAFHAVPIAGHEGRALPGLAALLSEGQRQAEAVSRLRPRLVRPGISLRRNENIKITDDPATTRVYVAIEQDSPYEGLRAALPHLSERQVLAALQDMLGREEILIVGESAPAEPLSREVRHALLEWLRMPDAPPLHHCTRFSVFSTPGRWGRRFLGLLTGREETCVALLATGDIRLALTAGCGEGRGACAGLAGSLLLFPAGDDNAQAPALALLARLREAGVAPLVVVLIPDEDGEPPPAVAEVARRCGIDTAATPILAMPAWTAAHARGMLAELVAAERHAAAGRQGRITGRFPAPRPQDQGGATGRFPAPARG
jgi:CheY-like chemotaxis protein